MFATKYILIKIIKIENNFDIEIPFGDLVGTKQQNIPEDYVYFGNQRILVFIEIGHKPKPKIIS